jgi:hypothetical protein
METKDILKKRIWVEKHQKNFGVIANELSKRRKILQDKLWDSKEEDIFNLLVGVVFGFVPLNLALFAVFGSVFDEEDKRDEKVIINEAMNFLFAITTLLYLERNEKGQYPLVVYRKPSEVPTGYIHLIDLPIDELRKELDKAIQAHGHKKRMGFIFDSFGKSEDAFQVKPIKKGYKLSHKAKSYRSAYLDYCEKSNEKLSKKDKAYLNKVLYHLTSPEFIKEFESEVSKLEKDYDKSIPNHSKYEAEIFKTGHKVTKKTNWGQMDVQKKNIEKSSGNKIKVKFENKVYDDMVKTVGEKPPRDKKSPDEVFNLAKSIIKRRRFVQELHKKYKKNIGNMFEEFKKKYPKIAIDDMIKDFKSKANEDQALIEVSEELKIKSIKYCARLYKEGSRNHTFNNIWKDYFKVVDSKSTINIKK